MAKCCENCYYGEVQAKRERLGIPCYVICRLTSNMFKGKYEIHIKDDKCNKWINKEK